MASLAFHSWITCSGSRLSLWPSFPAKYFIFVLCCVFLQIFRKWWPYVNYPLWWLMIIYAVLHLIVVYTYQFSVISDLYLGTNVTLAGLSTEKCEYFLAHLVHFCVLQSVVYTSICCPSVTSHSILSLFGFFCASLYLFISLSLYS